MYEHGLELFEPHERLQKKKKGLWKSDVSKIGLGSQSLSLIFPKQLEFQSSFTCPPVSAPLQTPVGSSIALWLICRSFQHSLCCNCCSLVVLAFYVLFVFFFFFFVAAEKVKTKWSAQLYRENRTPRAEVGRPPSLGHTVTSTMRFDVVSELPASPTVLYQLSLTGNMSGPYLRGEEKTEEHLQRFADRLEVKKKSCQNFVFKWRFLNRKEKKNVQQMLTRNGEESSSPLLLIQHKLGDMET